MARFLRTRLYLLVIGISLCLVHSCNSLKQVPLCDSNGLRENTVYKVEKNVDLQEDSLIIPKGCTLVFGHGTISNGIIIFDSTCIMGHPSFLNCKYYGKISIKKIDDRDFTSKDDNGTFSFLISNAINSGVKCDLYRDYRLKMNDVPGYSGLVFAEGLTSGAEIVFHDNVVYNDDTFIPTDIKPIIVLLNVSNVTINNCMFVDTKDHNTHHFARSSGCTFIQCYGDCEKINLLNCSQENGDCFLRSGVWVHDINNPSFTPRKGLTNSIISVKSKNVGYGLALYCGDSLNIQIETESPHRGFYCTGVSNSVIVYNGHNSLETKCHILIKDAVFLREDGIGTGFLDMKGCHNLKIKAVIDSLLPEERVICFQSYGSGRKEKADYRFRSEKCHHYNIDFTADIHNYPDDGYCIICDFVTESGALDFYDTYGCKMSNIYIHDINYRGGLSKKYIIQATPYTESNIDMVNCSLTDTGHDSSNDFGIQIIGTSTGIIKLKNCSLGFVEVKKKEYGEYVIKVENSFIKKESINYDNESSIDLVQINYR